MLNTLEIDIPAGGDWLSREELEGLTPAILRERTQALKPMIAERAARVEKNRRPDPEIWAALRRTGIFYMFVPKAFGGLEMTPEDLIDVMLPVSEACASTGWAACFSIEHNLALTKAFPDAFLAEIFGRYPYITAPGVQSPPAILTPVEGGYMLNAHWKWGSGVMNSDWVMGAAMIPREGAPPEMHSVLLPSRDVTVIDSWYMQGMSGTGSNDIVVKDYFIAADHVGRPALLSNDAAEAPTVLDTPLCRIPFQTLLALTTMLPALGAAREALALFQERIEGRKVLGTQSLYRDRESQHIRLGKADVQVTCAEQILRQAARDMFDAAARGQVGLEVRTSIRARIMHALDLCREATSSLVLASGATAHALDCPMQRYLRDLLVICNHGLYDSDLVYEQRGRNLLGFAPSDMLS